MVKFVIVIVGLALISLSELLFANSLEIIPKGKVLTEDDLEPAIAVIKAHLEKIGPYGLMASRGIEVAEDGTTITDSAAESNRKHSAELAATPSIPSDLDLQPKTGLSTTCLNKLCMYYEYALSCKAIGFNMKKVCAQYFMGRVLGCPIFPPATEFFNAPYICGVELGAIASSIINGMSTDSGIIPSYLAGNFSENCQRNCYQNYLVAAADFYDTCSANLTVFPQNTTYKVATQLQNFQILKEQICATSEFGQNCFSEIYQLKVQGGGAIDLFNPYCNYFGSPLYNEKLLIGSCAAFKNLGCCYQNQVTMVNQAQTNASDLVLFPPCFLNYMTVACPGVSNTKVCTHGTGGNMTIVAGTVDITTNAGPDKTSLPNMYDQDSVLQLQGVLMGALLATGLVQSDLAAMGLNQYKPLNMEIVKYVYFNDSGVATPASGIPPTMNGGEYAAAIQGIFSFQFMVASHDLESSNLLYNSITQNLVAYTGAIKLQYGTGPRNFATVRVTMDTSNNGPYFYAADPFVLPPKSGAAGLYAHKYISVWVGLLSIVCSFVLLI